jgi:hypothetical protein
MKFPSWVETPKSQPKHDLASKRLMYMLMHAALQTVPKGCMTKFAAHCSVDRSSLYKFCERGEISARTATAIEKAVGRDLIRHEWLMNPLSVKHTVR